MFLDPCNLGFEGDFQSSLLRLAEQWFLAKLDQSLPEFSPVKGLYKLLFPFWGQVLQIQTSIHTFRNTGDLIFFVYKPTYFLLPTSVSSDGRSLSETQFLLTC